ncbi:LysE family translocator [Herbaspirillum huttiense]|uniref:LysE family translocator n=1 Tax=Herbaspirillum huttiense TaxID=863372 RepID=UPI002E79D185|nr:LysE family translocator [Herbaspirillum huttiense]MEE1638053.1 LysE family translocator [Herbaspirillum huttiense NC40101]
MQHLAELIALSATLSVATMSPGPSFVMVARTSVGGGRANGLLAALGMGIGGVLFAGAALLGLQAVLLAVPSLYLVLKFGGGVYLAYMGWRIWRGARTPLMADDIALRDASPSMSRRSLWLGLVTQISNPKTAIAYTSVFAAFLPAETSLPFKGLTLLLVFLIEAGWYGLVAVALSSARPRRWYVQGKHWFDRTAGAVMMTLGFRLLLSRMGP